MDRAAVGPVVLVQSRGSTVLEQLRPDGSRLVLEAFHDESRLPQRPGCRPDRALCGVRDDVGDADRTRSAWSCATCAPATSSRLAEHPAAVRVRDWVTSGVVLTVALDPGGPPYRWVPGPGRPVPVSRRTAHTVGRSCWLPRRTGAAGRSTEDGCTGLVDRPRGSAGPAVLPEAARRARPPGRRTAIASWPAGPPRCSRSSTSAPGAPPGSAPRGGCSSRRWSWGGPDRVLVAVTTLAGGRGSVLRCRVGTGCACRWRSGERQSVAGPRAVAADDRQRGSIPQLSRVSQSCSTRSSSASSARDTHRTSAASSPGTGAGRPGDDAGVVPDVVRRAAGAVPHHGADPDADGHVQAGLLEHLALDRDRRRTRPARPGRRAPTRGRDRARAPAVRREGARRRRARVHPHRGHAVSRRVGSGNTPVSLGTWRGHARRPDHPRCRAAWW